MKEINIISPEAQANKRLESTLKSRDEAIRMLTKKNEDLSRQVKNFEALVFGSKSEQQVVIEENSDQLFLPFEGSVISPIEEEKAVPSSSNKKEKKKGGNQLVLSENLDVEEILIDIPDCEKFDPITEEAYSLIDYQITDKLIRIKACYKILRLKRPIYGAGKNGVVKAPLPESVAGFSKIDESIWSDIFVWRTCDHLPFYRQVEILARLGISVTRQTLNKTYLNVAELLRPLYSLLKKEILSYPAIYVDETTVKRQDPGKKKLGTSYLWVLCGSPPGHQGEPLVWMHYETNRKHENAKILIEDYDKIVHSDAYAAYENLAEEGQFIWAPCWIHAQRNFIKATENTFQKQTVDKFSAIMDMDNKSDNMMGKTRIDFRHKHVAPLIEELIKFLQENHLTPQVMMSDSLSKACGYFLNRARHFKAFLDYADAEMDNNAAERSIRPLKVGVRNWLFIGSKAGGDACAIMTSLLQSARNIGINPQEYIENVLRRLPYTLDENLHELLPHKWVKKENPKSPFLPPDYSF